MVLGIEHQNATPTYKFHLTFTGLVPTSLSAQEVKRNQSRRHGQYYRDVLACSSRRRSSCRRWPVDLKLAERLIMALVDRLVADSSIEVHADVFNRAIKDGNLPVCLQRAEAEFAQLITLLRDFSPAQLSTMRQDIEQLHTTAERRAKVKLMRKKPRDTTKH